MGIIPRINSLSYILYLVKTAILFPDDILIRVITETKDSIFFFFFFKVFPVPRGVYVR